MKNPSRFFLAFFFALIIAGASGCFCGFSDEDGSENGFPTGFPVVDDDGDMPDDDGDDDSATDDDTADDDTADDDTVECPDADGDGYRDAACGGEDCDDADRNVNPDAYDICGDGVDNDCDGTPDNPPHPDLNLPEFILGVVQAGEMAATWLPELGIHWSRPTISWRTVMPVVSDLTLSLQDVLDHPEMVDDFIDNANWDGADNHMRLLIGAGIQPFPVIGHGYTSAHSLIDGEPASPDRIGRDTYLAYMYLYTRALVERYDGDGYKDAEGIVVKFWQTENELNQALLTAAWGWRTPSWLDALSSAWADWDFLTELLALLYRSVHDADPEAITTQNIHTDVHPNVNRMIFQKTWIEAATDWREHMDLIGFDAYLNYYVAEPVMGYKVGDHVRALQEASCGKPVIGMEIGYPTGPAQLGYTWENQAQYINDALTSAYEAGAVGYFQFGLKSADSHGVDISPQDAATLEMVGHWWHDGDALLMLIWALWNLDYIQDHFLRVIQSVEGYWGVVGPGDVRKDSFAVLQSLAEEIGNP